MLPDLFINGSKIEREVSEKFFIVIFDENILGFSQITVVHNCHSNNKKKYCYNKENVTNKKISL